MIKTVPKKKKGKRAKQLPEETLQIAVKRREAKGKGETEIPFECRVPKNSKERYESLPQKKRKKEKKAFLSDQCKELEENNRTGKTRNLFKKIRDTNRMFHAKMSSIKDRNGMDLTEREDIKKMWQEYTKNYIKKIFMTQITMMVLSLT